MFLMNGITEKVFSVFLLIGVFSGTVYSEGTPVDSAQKKAADQVSGEGNLGGGNGQHEMFDMTSTSTRFQYHADGRRDPFLSFVHQEGERIEGVPPLQSVAVSELKLIGVASGQGRVNAMLQVPGGKSYPVTIGTRVGINRGRVRRIDTQSVTVEEPYLNIFGRTALQQVVLKLYTDKERQE